MKLLDIPIFLAKENAPHILTSNHIDMLLGYPNASTRSRAIVTLVEHGALKKACRGIYFNSLSNYDKAEILSFVIPAGALSMASVLGRAGVTNNPSQHLHVVVPLDTPGFGRNNKELDDGTRILIHSIPKNFLTFGAGKMGRFNAATPEKALCDWLYLSKSPRSDVTDVPDDIDMLDFIDTVKLAEFAKIMDVEDRLQDLLNRQADSEKYYQNARSMF